MNVREMHMQLNQALQKVAANKTRKYLSEEIDLALNKVQGRFIQSKLRPRGGGAFAIDELDVDAIRPILIRATLDAYIKPGGYFSPLPVDYEYLVSDASITTDLCGRTAIAAPKSLFITWLKQSKTTKSMAPFYETLTATVNNTNELGIPGNLGQPNYYKGFQKTEDVSFLTDWIQCYWNKLGVQCAWEKFGQFYNPGYWAFPGSTGEIPVTLSYDGVDVTAVKNQQVDLQVNTPFPDSTNAANRLTSSEKIANMLDTAFFKPSARSPISELIVNTLFIYTDNSFIVSNVEVTYVRKPQPISLALGSDCELAPEFHQTICDLTTEYILGTIGDSTQRSIVERDNETRVTL